MTNCYINKRKIGSGCPAYMIAEMSGNHKGSLNQAKKLIHAAKNAGADAIKLQTYRPDTMTLKTNNLDFRIPSDDPWSKENFLYDLYEKAFTPWEWHEVLYEEAHKIGLTIFSSPFDKNAVDLLDSLNTPAYKIASPEITDIPLIKYVAKKGKPILISTGMANKKDLELAISTIRNEGVEDIIILKCTSNYPTYHKDMNLKAIPMLQNDFNCIIGISDHSTDHIAPVAATVLGAAVIEKHFIIDRKENTVDSFFSIDKEEFSEMVSQVRKTEAALGCATYKLPDDVDLWARRSLYVSKDIKKGTQFSENNIASVRPSLGLHPKYYNKIIGKKATRNLTNGDRLTLEDLNS